MKSSKIRFGKKPISTKQTTVNILCQAQKGQYTQLDEPTEINFEKQTYKQSEIDILIKLKYNWQGFSRRGGKTNG